MPNGPLDPEAYLDSLEPIGWRLGLERMHRLNAVLGMPQHRFSSIHVVGTNGKSSVARMIAALLEGHGLSAGASLSPHAMRWSERVLIRGREIGGEEFASAVQRAAEAAQVVNRGLEDGDLVTQFELATAAAFVALAAARVEVAPIEAGLGGRLDATNTIPSRVTVLTSVGLDHTEWLGDTLEEIAAEKLAVLRDHSTLVLGSVPEPVRALAQIAVKERGAKLVPAPEDPGPTVSLRARGPFQRRNFALARAAVEEFLGEVDEQRVASLAGGLTIPGRLEQVADAPVAFLDAAHNPDGAAALAEAIPEIAGGRPVVACLAVLGDKDAAGMVRALASSLERAVCSEVPSLPAEAATARDIRDSPGRRRSVAAAELAHICDGVGLPAEEEPHFGAAVARARDLAVRGDGVLLVTGSHYVLGPARAVLRQ